MRVSKRVFYFGSGLAALALIAAPAIASHGKVGLWSVTVTMNMPGMPDLSSLPPQAQAAMRARGMTMNGHTMTVQHCMTQEEVNAIKPPPMRGGQDCKMSNLKTAGQSFSADLVCSGEMNATGHFEISYDSAEHYTGKSTISGTENGHPINSTTTMEGRWVSADCKGVAH
jgi:Protein of unknown function (DUF3617)